MHSTQPLCIVFLCLAVAKEARKLSKAAKKVEWKKEKREANQMIGEPRRAVQSGWQSGPGRGARHHAPAMQQALLFMHVDMLNHALAYQPLPPPPPSPMYHPPPISRSDVFDNGFGAQRGGYCNQQLPQTPASGLNAM
jgi:hypothetical protein